MQASRFSVAGCGSCLAGSYLPTAQARPQGPAPQARPPQGPPIGEVRREDLEATLGTRSETFMTLPSFSSYTYVPPGAEDFLVLVGIRPSYKPKTRRFLAGRS